ncbi:hypothetical protein BGW36DRAFT_356050 [Talaromyces proteolyticus]|uniref:Uncharacterized protein n=1 Tax=Talaromyces proteolyticus TaxID=1131652 RepID=A0AAD4KX41_9EURO|nr:uncharacterized protein BGW36DRAFT_356050 [Talaromyces proteolyticus]KAH8701905.1 hypothetical protein BGW36DRAFT_356050 [Talaromyces proteolyticus]
MYGHRQSCNLLNVDAISHAFTSVFIFYPYVTSEPSKKSSKIPNPSIITDSKDPKLSAYELGICYKLLSNADHYPTAENHIMYVIKCCGGKAARDIISRTSPTR